MKQEAKNFALKIADHRPMRLVPPGKRSNFQKIAITDIDETRFIAYDDIIYCESTNNYTNIITRQGRSFTCCKTLKDVENRLPADLFMRIHASYLVNIQDITALKRKCNWEVEVDNDRLLPVSRLKKQELLVVLGC
ncbi:MAG: LytTR family DNA-binding domain-containing protein [Ferruginibacter sp.]